jgi:hypothetical protein
MQQIAPHSSGVQSFSDQTWNPLMPASKPQPSPEYVTPDDPAEYQRFRDMAREVGADEDPEALDRAFAKVVKVGALKEGSKRSRSKS